MYHSTKRPRKNSSNAKTTDLLQEITFACLGRSPPAKVFFFKFFFSIVADVCTFLRYLCQLAIACAFVVVIANACGRYEDRACNARGVAVYNTARKHLRGNLSRLGSYREVMPAPGSHKRAARLAVIFRVCSLVRQKDNRPLSLSRFFYVSIVHSLMGFSFLLPPDPTPPHLPLRPPVPTHLSRLYAILEGI